MEQSETSNQDIPARRAVILSLSIVVLALALRAWKLWVPEYSTDEELSTGLAQLGYGDLFSNLAGRPPLSFLIQKLVVDVTGSVSAGVLRIPSVVEGVLGVIAVVVFGWRWCGRWTGVVAGALLAVSFFHWELSRDARYYPLLFLCSVLAVDGYLGWLVRRNWWSLPILLVGAAGVMLTHYSGFLLIGALGLMAPVLLAGKGWRDAFLLRPRVWGGVGVALVLSGAVAAWMLRGYLRVPLSHLSWPDPERTLTPLFDVSGRFLLSQFSVVTGLAGWLEWLGIGLGAAGVVAIFVRCPRLGGVLAGVVVIPFLALYLFPVDHWWTPKYFVYMLLPVTLCLAHGIVLVGQAAGRVPVGGGVVPRIVVAGALLLAVSLPNVVSMGRSLWYVYNPHEDLAKDLSAWTAQGDVIYTSWRERQRVLRHAYEPAEHGTRFSFLTSQAPFPFTPASAHSQWFVATGKVEVHPPFAAEMLSEKFARVPYHEFFLAHAPNPQRVVFGETFRGLPEVTGPLVIPPGSHVELPVVMPRAGRRAVYAEFAPASLARGLAVGLGEEGANTVQQVSPRKNYLRLGELDFQRGKALLRLENPSDQLPVTVSAIEAVPSLDTEPVVIPAWDFYSMDGGESVATVWPEHLEGRVLLRDMRLGHTAYYRFESRRGGPTVIRVFALNDPPGTNDYQIFLVGAGLEAIRLSFDAEDGEVGYRDTPVLNLPAGVHTLAVTYLGVDPEVLRERTENFRIMTRERLQHPGLDRIELYNVGGN